MGDKEEIRSIIINGLDGKRPASEDQKRAIFSEKRYIRVLAGAGAGKTETLTRRILYLLLYKDIPPEEIVAFTFTEMAAQSMKSRIYQYVSRLMGEDYASQLGKMYIGTIHGYALRVLQDYFGYGGYDVLDEKQEMALLMRVGWELGLSKIKNKVKVNYGKICELFLNTVNLVYDELIDRKQLKKKEPEFYKMLEKYEKKLDEYRRLTFGRIIYLAVENLRKKPDKRPEIRYLIVDEYQDINRAQEELIMLLGKDANIMVVGDPRQTIYQWRGSDDRCFERFLELFPKSDNNTDDIIIPENRRSGRKIVEVGNLVADSFENRKFPHMKPEQNFDGHVYISISENPEEEAKWIADQIEELVRSKGLKYSDFGILLRSVNTSGDVFVREFKKRGIPYLIGGSIGLFRREETKALGKLFAWLSKKGFWKERSGGSISNGKLLDSALDDWTSATNLIPTSEREKVKADLKKWREEVRSGNFSCFQDAYHAVLKILKFDQLDPNNKLHVAIMANLGRFSNLLGDYENAIRLGGRKLKWNDSNFDGLNWYLNLYATGAYEEQSSDDLRGLDVVQITTVHQAKGLEWAVVFVPALVKDRFPPSKTGGKRRWLIKENSFEDLGIDIERYDSKLEDERRLFYVAVTRAKSTLVLSYFKRTSRDREVSEFLRILENQHHISRIQAKTNESIEVDNTSRKDEEDSISVFDAGEIIDYIKCPYFYRMRHVWHYNAPITEELGYGNALHYCLRKAVEMHRNEGYEPSEAIKKAVEDEFFLPYAPKTKAKKIKEAAKNILERYVKKHIDDILSVAEVEYRIEFPKDKAIITGKVDVIIDRDDGVEVREYKTSQKVTKPEHSKMQVLLYALGLKKWGYNVKKGSVAYLNDARIDPVEVDENSLRDVEKEARKRLKNIIDHKYDPCPGDFCSSCDYRKLCKWSKAGS